MFRVDGLGDRFQARFLTDADTHGGAVLSAYRHGLGVVVAVQVGDQEPADVRESVSDGAQGLFQLLPGFLQRPAAVDQDQVAAGLDDVHVDRAQPVLW